MPEPLTLQCAELASDTLEVCPRMTTNYVNCLRLLFDGGSSNSVYLDPDAARQLFNYLGVWLHTQGSD